jgi:hypothetical protein
MVFHSSIDKTKPIDVICTEVFIYGFQCNYMIVDFSSPKQLNYNLQCKLKVTHTLSLSKLMINNAEVHSIIIYKHKRIYNSMH